MFLLYSVFDVNSQKWYRVMGEIYFSICNRFVESRSILKEQCIFDSQIKLYVKAYSWCVYIDNCFNTYVWLSNHWMHNRVFFLLLFASISMLSLKINNPPKAILILYFLELYICLCYRYKCIFIFVVGDLIVDNS
jgi:hypothetical protein